MEDKVEELLLEQLKDAYSAEKQALRCMQQTTRKVTSPALRTTIETHVEETKVQIGRLDEIFQTMNAKPGRKLCLAMKGLVEEASAEAGEQSKGAILDLVIAASMQRIEHYEMSAYGTLTMTAEALKLQPVLKALQETLSEEQQTEAKLAQLTRNELMTAALEEEIKEKPAQRASSARGKPKGAPAEKTVAKSAPTKSAPAKSAKASGAKPVPPKPPASKLAARRAR